MTNQNNDGIPTAADRTSKHLGTRKKKGNSLSRKKQKTKSTKKKIKDKKSSFKGKF